MFHSAHDPPASGHLQSRKGASSFDLHMFLVLQAHAYLLLTVPCLWYTGSSQASSEDEDSFCSSTSQESSDHDDGASFSHQGTTSVTSSVQQDSSAAATQQAIPATTSSVHQRGMSSIIPSSRLHSSMPAAAAPTHHHLSLILSCPVSDSCLPSPTSISLHADSRQTPSSLPVISATAPSKGNLLPKEDVAALAASGFHPMAESTANLLQGHFTASAAGVLQAAEPSEAVPIPKDASLPCTPVTEPPTSSTPIK